MLLLLLQKKCQEKLDQLIARKWGKPVLSSASLSWRSLVCLSSRGGRGLKRCGLCQMVLAQSPHTKIHWEDIKEPFPKQAWLGVCLAATSMAGLLWEPGRSWDSAWLRVPLPWTMRLRGALGFSSAPLGGEEHCWVAHLCSLILSISTFSCCFSPLPSPLYLSTWMISYTNQFCQIYQQLSHIFFFFFFLANNLHILKFH